MTQAEGIRLPGKTVIVTGGYTFLGKGIALGFAKAGADLGIIARTPAKLEAAADEIRSCGVRTAALVADITDESQVVGAFQRAADVLGRIDILVNNVGIRPDGRMPIHDMDLATWNEVIATNLTGAMLCSREAVRHMVAQGEGGAIVNIGSLAGKQASPGLGPLQRLKGRASRPHPGARPGGRPAGHSLQLHCAGHRRGAPHRARSRRYGQAEGRHAPGRARSASRPVCPRTRRQPPGTRWPDALPRLGCFQRHDRPGHQPLSRRRVPLTRHVPGSEPPSRRVEIWCRR